MIDKVLLDLLDRARIGATKGAPVRFGVEGRSERELSDIEGKYSYCGLTPTTHVLRVDHTTLPAGSRLTMSSNRNAGDADVEV